MSKLFIALFTTALAVILVVIGVTLTIQYFTNH